MMRKGTRELSDQQVKILTVLESYLKKKGYSPSIRDICEEADISSPSVANYYLNELQEMGYIDYGQSEGFRLLKPVHENGNLKYAD